MKELRHLNKYFLKYKIRFILGIIFVVMSNLFSVFPAKSVQKAIDSLGETLKKYQSPSGLSLNAETASLIMQLVLYSAGLILLFAVIRGIFMYMMRQTLIVMSRHIEFDLKNEIFNHYQLLDLAFYRRNNTGDMMARISEDVSRVRMYIGPAIMYFTNLIATFLVIIPTMFAVNVKLATYVLLPLPVLSWSIFYINNIINRKSDAIQSQLSRITSFVQEAFNGIRVIKAFGVEGYSREEFSVHVDEYRKRSLDLAKVDATFFPLMVFLTGLSTIITVFAGGIMVIRGEITVGNIAEFIFYVNLLIWPVAALGFTTSLIQRAAASQARINEFLGTRPEIVSSEDLPFQFRETIEFREVSFKYSGKNEYALRNINFNLRKGKILAILGTTGSGKSTLMQLLLRMMDVEEGGIYIDGVNLKDINLRKIKDVIGYAPQDVFLFSDTIANNILFGIRKDTEKREELLVQAAESAALSSTIREFPMGFETIIGERGITLSGGQKQRVAIARALIKDPELLILDDCLSAVDTNTEAIILGNLRRVMSKRTGIIVSHRVSTVKDAEDILILDQGSIVESGNHDQLMQLNGRYAELYAKQIAEESLHRL